MKSNLKKLDVGLRGTLNEFKATYTLGFLKKNGYNAYIPSNSFNNHPLCETVQTKYGEMVIYGFDVITYVGNGIWSTERSQRNMPRVAFKVLLFIVANVFYVVMGILEEQYYEPMASRNAIQVLDIVTFLPHGSC